MFFVGFNNKVLVLNRNSFLTKLWLLSDNQGKLHLILDLCLIANKTLPFIA
jgi:hypothetical protein